MDDPQSVRKVRLVGHELDHNAEILDLKDVYSFETAEISEKNITRISDDDYAEGSFSNRYMTSCLKCERPIRGSTVRDNDNGYGVSWSCEKCGLLKETKDKVIVFLEGCAKYDISERDVTKYQVRRFPWRQANKALVLINGMYLRVALCARKQMERYQEVLKGADFIAFLGVYDALSRAWCASEEFKFIAIRVQGVILINFTTGNRAENVHGLKQERIIRNLTAPPPASYENIEAKHYQLKTSVLQSGRAGLKRNIMLATICEVDHIEDGEPIEIKSSKFTKEELRAKEWWKSTVLRWLMRLRLSGIWKIKHKYRDGLIEYMTSDEINAIVEQDSDLKRRHSDISLDCLAEILSAVQHCLSEDGQHCLMEFQPNSERFCGKMTVKPLGEADYDCLFPEFRKEFGV